MYSAHDDKQAVRAFHGTGAATGQLAHSSALIQEVLPGICNAVMQPVQVGGHSCKIAVHVVQGDLQGGLPALLLLDSGVEPLISLYNSLQLLYQLLILLQRFLQTQVEARQVGSTMLMYRIHNAC